MQQYTSSRHIQHGNISLTFVNVFEFPLVHNYLRTDKKIFVNVNGLGEIFISILGLLFGLIILSH